jgi:hypothetical protein
MVAVNMKYMFVLAALLHYRPKTYTNGIATTKVFNLLYGKEE